MKASPNDQNELLKLQDVDTKVRQLDHIAGRLPQVAELAILTGKLEEINSARAQKRGELEDAKIELGRVESDVAVVETRVKRDAERLEHSASMKDAQALESELVSLRRRQDDLEEIELRVMEKVETIEGDLAAIEADRSLVADESALLTKALEHERGQIDSQKAQLMAERRAVEQTLPPELIALYEKQRARYGVGAALLLRGVSLGSNVKLTESDLAVIRRAELDDVVLCPDSGAILIRNEESGL